MEQLRSAGVESQNKLMEKQKQQLQQLQNQHRERLENLINQKVGNNVEKTLHDDKSGDCPSNNVGFIIKVLMSFLAGNGSKHGTKVTVRNLGGAVMEGRKKAN